MSSITRRQALALGAAAAVSACAAERPATKAAPAAPAPKPGRLFASTAAGLALVDLATGRVKAAYPAAVADGTWTTVHQLTAGRLRSYRVGTGALLADEPVTGRQIKAVSTRLIAVGPPPGPRRRTRITLVGENETRALELDGNIEPEAFSGDGRAMYLLDHLPPERPDRYRVRMYDLETGEMGPLQTRDKTQIPRGAEEEMRGRGRQAVLDSTAGVLYTLYTHQDDHLHTRDLVAGRDQSPGVHAFVHVLNLDQRWAYCLDLPAPFGLGPPEAHTIALDAAGKRLYAFDASTGSVVVASTDDQAIRRSGRLGERPAGEAYAAAGGQRLYLAVGSRVLVADGQTLAPLADWPLPGPARGVLWTADELLAGAGDQVIRLDPGTGARLGAFPLPGLQAVRHAAPTG
ncbi:YncE family protein [Nonomuraea sp. 10N515B]|uniref:YncE family protein n=1 Tax=Nonomuraea sp. 10N515B TaxID=3457422 RepID=UPI003FCE0A01